MLSLTEVLFKKYWIAFGKHLIFAIILILFDSDKEERELRILDESVHFKSESINVY